MPHSELSKYLESRVNNYLQSQLGENCKNEVVIRVLQSSDKKVETKQLIRQKYGVPEIFPYRNKAVFAFEIINDVEVCFFGLHVQEYGSECPAPNSRRVYIAYLDSVHFFEPAKLRTNVYHEILLGYLDYARKGGYTMAHLWACPPSEGDDYIFHCHPPEQKIPKHKRLSEWYRAMCDKGQEQGVVEEYKNIYQQVSFFD
uniref:histone acetyltransferase n=1 Tax=Panagrolaimus davidi TaxID=227884 RepID=A0A914PKW8_9BILA